MAYANSVNACRAVAAALRLADIIHITNIYCIFHRAPRGLQAQEACQGSTEVMFYIY